jgi:hypothetical protein
MRLLLSLLIFLVALPLRAEEPLLKPNDVIAIVGGEDMVVLSELGYLERLLQQALPAHKLKFRSLAWEGDTVFEQRRDLNYPSLEAQLEKIGATVVIAQFGTMERITNPSDARGFREAYGKLLARLKGQSGRRVVILAPMPANPTRLRKGSRVPATDPFTDAAKELCAESAAVWVDPFRWISPLSGMAVPNMKLETRDGPHLTEASHASLANVVVQNLFPKPRPNEFPTRLILGGSEEAQQVAQATNQLRSAVIAKNRLWFHYARPQNWAFLAGDRTNQPSSRDHKDLTKRWFPGELEKFVPLIEAKEQEIWKLAAALNP